MKITITIFIIFLGALSAVGKNTNKPDSSSRAGVTIYINQPLGFMNKVRLKAGYKTEQNSTYLLSFTSFHSNLPLLFGEIEFTGIQLCFEYQHALTKGDQGEIFIYGKTGIGDFNYKNTDNGFLLFGGSLTKRAAGNYVLLGAGFGQELFFNKSKTFFLQLNEGVKICNIYQSSGADVSNDFQTFISPGSLIDLNINFGLRF